MTAKRLTVVDPDAAPEPKKKRLTVTEAAAVGTPRDLYAAMRERVAIAVEDPNCPPRDLAALTRRLSELAKDIAAIDAQEAEDGDDEATPDEAWEAV